MGACATVRCLPRSTALRIYYLFIPASMTGLARSSAHTVRDHATHPHVRVSCSLGALLAQLTRARRSSSGEDSGRPAAARHPWTTPTFVIGWTHFDGRAYPCCHSTPPPWRRPRASTPNPVLRYPSRGDCSLRARHGRPLFAAASRDAALLRMACPMRLVRMLLVTVVPLALALGGCATQK